MKIELEKYFDGEQSWLEFSELFDEIWENSQFQNELLVLLNGQIDLAKVIYYYNQKNSIDWLNKKVPALDGLSPMECISDETLTKRLKVCLMRMK